MRRGAKGEAFEAHRLPDLYLERAGNLGTSEDLDSADAASVKNVSTDPGDGEVRLARAHVLGALHRFDEALKELDVAAASKAPVDEVARARATIFLATGRCAEVSAILPPRSYPVDLTVRGVLEQRLGHPALAETLFERARLEFNDVSPLRLGWIDFERSRALEREGDNVRARAYLEDALVGFPQYAHAAVHLAALEPGDRAIAHLVEVEKRATDPDVFAAHADALRRLKRDAEAGAMTDRARTRFEEVLTKHPEAYADHAARFFLGAGSDVPRALVLAKSAAAQAPTDETLELWLRAARVAGATDQVCAVVVAADKTSCARRTLRAELDAARKTCKP